MMRVINPAVEEVVGEFREHSAEEVEGALVRARGAFGEWRGTSFEYRAHLMKRVAGVLRERKEALAKLMAVEMGKLIVAGEGEIEKCAWVCEFFAEHAERFLAVETVGTDASESYVRYDPLGVVLAIMPWNFPFWQVFRFAAPGLMAGNVGVLKHASNVPGCGLAIESVFKEAGFPEGCFTTLMVGGAEVERIIAHPAIAAVTLTGSEQAGMAVAAAAGKALKKSVLELGGSDPFIVLKDVEIDAVAQAAAQAWCINSGQSCIAAKRFIVEGAIVEAFEKALVVEMRKLRVGDPLDRVTQVGPLARKDVMESVDEQVKRSVQAGAKLLCGGKRVDRRGYFYEPTVLGGVRPGMAAFDEEVFGPVAAVIAAEDAQEAVKLANQSKYGLGASVWTGDMELARRMAGELEAGCVFVNGLVKSDPRLPFGGVKLSGYGRELAEVGIREFVNIKSVWIK